MPSLIPITHLAHPFSLPPSTLSLFFIVKSLLNTENRLRVPGEEVGGGMGIKEGTCWDEHWVLYVSDESLNSTPETNTTLYFN